MRASKVNKESFFEGGEEVKEENDCKGLPYNNRSLGPFETTSLNTIKYYYNPMWDREAKCNVPLHPPVLSVEDDQKGLYTQHYDRIIADYVSKI